MDWLKLAREQIQPLIDAGTEHFRETAEYNLTFGEIMLELYLKKGDFLIKMGLKQRKKPIYSSKGEITDIAVFSGIEVPSDQEIGQIKTGTLEEIAEGVRFRNGLAEKEDVARSVYNLFTTIRVYESLRIMHPAGVTQTGVGRRAHVSVTGMGILREFDLEMLRNMPDTYHTRYTKQI